MAVERRILRPKKHLSPSPPSDVAVPPIKKTRKDHAQAYRDRVKDNPALYKVMRAEETLRNQEYRRNRSEEAIVRNRGLQKLRQRRYRQRLQERQQKEKRTPKARHTLEGKGTSETRSTLGGKRTFDTWSTMQEQRKRWAEEKRVQRAKMSQEKRADTNSRRRDAYAAKTTVQIRLL